MNVKELIEMLKELPQDAKVILSKDGEGNDYSPLSDGYTVGKYLAHGTWSGEFQSDRDSRDLDTQEQLDADKSVKAIVLWPIN